MNATAKRALGCGLILAPLVAIFVIVSIAIGINALMAMSGAFVVLASVIAGVIFVQAADE